MKKFSLKRIPITISILMATLFCLSMTACGDSANELLQIRISTDSKVLVAYFSWADNTTAVDPSSVDLDARTSASVLPPGNAGLLADWIGEETGGDVFPIIVGDPYPDDYDECLDRAADELDEGARPELVGVVENLEDYDLIFLGYPNWWGTCPMPIITFLESYDFSGKTVVPFCTHGTGGLGRSVEDLTAALPASCTVLPALGVSREDAASNGKRQVTEWLNELTGAQETQP